MSSEDVTSEEEPSDLTSANPSTRARVVSYNVLSSSLCESDYHVKCKPSNLDEQKRLKKVINLLDEEVEKQSIICLQEVSTKWAGSLHTFFCEQGYHMIHMGYGNKFDGYMGVSISFPTTKFRLKESRIVRVSDLKSWPKPPPENPFKRLKGAVKSLWWKIRQIRPPIDPVFDAKKRANQMIVLNIEDRETETSFWVATYHMPCQFRVPAVMVTHTSLALSEAQLAARNQPLIFCGDFNFKPGDSPYNLVTQGFIAKDDQHYPTMPANDPWVPKIRYAMKSAYHLLNNKEPQYTNWAYTKGSTEDFIGCLDYVFVSPGISVEAVKELEEISDPPQGPFPSDTEPSDHVLIAADLSIVHEGNTGWTEQDEIWKRQIEDKLTKLLKDEKGEKIRFPSSLNSFQRHYIHQFAAEIGLESKSSGQGRRRQISVWKQARSEG